MKLATGRAMPYPVLLETGVNVCLGTDGCASNNNLDMFEEVKTAALLQKFFWNDPTVLPAHDALLLATENGGKALGFGTGKLSIGAPADIILVVTNPEVSAVRDADRIIGLVEAEEKGPARLVINRIKPNLVKREDMLSPDDVLELLAVELIGVIPEDENVILSTNRGLPIVLNGKSQAGQAFRNIAARLRGEQVPFIDINDQGGFFGRLARRIRSGGA